MSEPGCAPFTPSQNIICTVLPAKELSCRAGGKLIEVFARSPEGDNITASCTPPPSRPLAHSRSSPSLRQQVWSLQFIRVRNSKFTGQANYQHNTSAGWDPNTEAGRQRDGCEEHQHLRSLPWPTASAKKKKTPTEKYMQVVKKS